MTWRAPSPARGGVQSPTWRAGPPWPTLSSARPTGWHAGAAWALVARPGSVAAASCVDANVASSAAIVRGQRAPDWLLSQELPSRLVSQGGAALHLAGWTDQGDDLPQVSEAA